jgi:RecJ-like exonuclease
MTKRKLEPCSKCKGKGSVTIDNEEWCCDKCDGWGQLDWIEQITGVNSDNIPWVTEYTMKENLNETKKKETVERRDGIL